MGKFDRKVVDLVVVGVVAAILEVVVVGFLVEVEEAVVRKEMC
jgi:hypothetical protein